MSKYIDLVKKGKEWAIKHVKDKDLIRVLAISEHKFKKPCFTQKEVGVSRFYYGVYQNCRTRLENERKK